jgi:3-dehydroquinate synthase
MQDASSLVIRSSHHDYQVHFIPDFRQAIKELMGKGKCAFLIDRKIWDLYQLAKIIEVESNIVHLIEAVESNKTLDGAIEVIERWDSAGVTKRHSVIVIGGGILQDIGAFCSCIYLRNIDWYLFPTTLLAQCDSCIGAKSSINFRTYKNQLGTFYAPKQIFVDTGLLSTLTEADFYSGMGEVLKLSLTSDAKFFEDLRTMVVHRTLKENIGPLIRRSLLVKQAIIEEDEYEKGRRKLLNYGHTFGHALESYSDNQIPHGAAVCLGLDLANYIAWKKGLISESDFRSVREMVVQFYRIPFPLVEDTDRYVSLLKKDKKAEGEKVNFVMLKRIGELQIVPMSLDGSLKGLIQEYFRTGLS